MRIHWSEKAIRELNEILVWIADDKLDDAILVSQRIDTSSSQLVAMPYLGRVGRVRGTRELVVPSTGYILVYRIVGDRIEIAGIRRGARR